jgi:hypothetical protein
MKTYQIKPGISFKYALFCVLINLKRRVRATHMRIARPKPTLVLYIIHVQDPSLINLSM